jgi:hypothetical protein
VLKRPLKPGARSKRCRENRPLPGVGRRGTSESELEARVLINAGPGRSRRAALTPPGKGGIARATGSQKRGDGDAALRTSGGAQWVLLKSTAGLDTQVASCSSSMSVNRAGAFQRTRLSRDVAPPVLGCCGLHRTRWVLSTLPCSPSPCPGHYPRHLATTAALLPYSSRRLGSPIVSRLRCSVLRSPFRWVPRSLRVAGVKCLLSANGGCVEITPHAL